MKFEHGHQKVKRWMPIINFKNAPSSIMEFAALELPLKCYSEQNALGKRKRAWDESMNHSALGHDCASAIETDNAMHARLVGLLGSSMRQHSGCYLATYVEEVEFECNVHTIGHYVSFVPQGQSESVLGLITSILIVDPPCEIDGSRRCILEHHGDYVGKSDAESLGRRV